MTDRSTRPASERRRFRRARMILLGAIATGAETAKPAEAECVVLDLSVTGARLRLDGSVPNQGLVTLRTRRFPPLTAQVVWRAGAEAGLRFLRPPAETAALFAGVLPETYRVA